MKINYLESPISLLYKKLSPAAIGSMLTATVASLIDILILSYFLGPTMLSSVSICMPIYMIINALTMLIASGAATVYAFYIGKNDRNEANKYYTTAFAVVIAIGIALMIIGVFNTEGIVRFLGADDSIIKDTLAYAQVLMYFMIPLMLYSLMLFFVRFDSDPNRTLVSTLVCAGVNLVLDILFIGPFGWGAAGAALATCLAYTVGLLVNCTHFLKKSNTLKLVWKGINFSRIYRSMKAGMPLFLSQFGMAVTTSVFNILIMQFGGANYVSIYAIITQLSMIAMAFYEGIAQAAQPIFSACFGANKLDRIKEIFKKGFLYELIITLGCLILCIVGATFLAKCFSIPEGALLDEASNAIRTYGLAIPITGINVFIMYYFQSREKVKTSILISLLHSSVCMILGLVALSFAFGSGGIWWTWLLAETVTLIISSLCMYIEKRRTII